MHLLCFVIIQLVSGIQITSITPVFSNCTSTLIRVNWTTVSQDPYDFNIYFSEDQGGRVTEIYNNVVAFEHSYVDLPASFFTASVNARLNFGSDDTILAQSPPFTVVNLPPFFSTRLKLLLFRLHVQKRQHGIPSTHKV